MVSSPIWVLSFHLPWALFLSYYCLPWTSGHNGNKVNIVWWAIWKYVFPPPLLQNNFSHENFQVWFAIPKLMEGTGFFPYVICIDLLDGFFPHVMHTFSSPEQLLDCTINLFATGSWALSKVSLQLSNRMSPATVEQRCTPEGRLNICNCLRSPDT